MAAVHRLARIRSIAARREERSRESTVQICDAKPLAATRADQRGCVSQTILAAGNESRSAATAGKVCTMSPSDPRRTTRRRGSAMRALADALKKATRGMVLRITAYGHA